MVWCWLYNVMLKHSLQRQATTQSSPRHPQDINGTEEQCRFEGLMCETDAREQSLPHTAAKIVQLDHKLGELQQSLALQAKFNLRATFSTAYRHSDIGVMRAAYNGAAHIPD